MIELKRDVPFDPDLLATSSPRDPQRLRAFLAQNELRQLAKQLKISLKS